MEIDIRAIQMKELEILKAVADICERHGLRYFLDGGTCLGAVRHQGFIPWDDDIDIGMPRKDFDRFRQIAPRELPEFFAVQDFENVHHMNHLFIKVHDIRTTYIAKAYENIPDIHTGVYVDIFPYDGYPAHGLRHWWWRGRTGIYLFADWLLRMYDQHDTLYDKMRWVLACVLRKVLPYNWASKRIEAFLRKYDMEKEEEVTLAIFSFKYHFPRSCFAGAVDLPFEGVPMPCPVDYDTYLKVHYGDYMTLPPEEERVPTHTTAYVSLDRSFTERWWEQDRDD